MSEVTGKRDETQAVPPAADRHEDLIRARRRRLLLGAAAVPTVYTLMSGAGVAAASLNCWDATPTQTTTPQRVTLGPDQWYRAPMKSGTQWPGNTQMAYCMKDPKDQLSGCTDPLSPDQSAASTYWWTNGQRTLEAQGGVRHIPKTSGYGLLYVDRTGTVQAFDPQAHPGVELKYASIACMGSITLATKSMLG
jgi:hypothetical protein